MKLHTLNYSCIINSTSDKVFDFHTDTSNLLLITPPWIKVKIISADLPLKEKSQITLCVKRFGISTTWKMEIDKLNPPYSLVDLMISGPFSFFRHQRNFTQLENNQTLMREMISFSIPFGWVGNLLYPIIKKDMDKMFSYRHKATKEYFNKIA